MRNCLIIIFLFLQSLVSVIELQAQNDTTFAPDKGFFLAKRKGLLGRIGESISIANVPEDTIIKNDEYFKIYEGLTIRHIYIHEINFGSSIYNTTNNDKNFTTQVADFLHKKTREYVIRKNLYFIEGDTIFPYLISDNERFLREQPFLQDVRIKLLPDSSCNYVDVFVIVKDVLSIGANLSIQNVNSGELELKEENILGYGDRMSGKIFYDNKRRQNIGLGASYTKRNFLGTFTDMTFTIQNYQPTINSGNKQESNYAISFNKPIINAYSKWAYNFTAAYHNNINQYFSDSIFLNDQVYRYQEFDIWAAYNFGTLSRQLNVKSLNRVRNYFAGRIFSTIFNEIPKKYQNEYNKIYADLIGILGSYTISRQDFYKARFVYGFGRNEDIPEGYKISIIGGFTDKAQRNRNYVGIELQKNKFNKNGHYFNYGAKLSSFIYKKKLEDITFFANLEYFSKLLKINSYWNHRVFLSGSFTRLGKLTLHDPLFLKSNYGLPEFNNGDIRAELRATLNGEVVFFNKWSLYGFKFAPFIFGGVSFLTPSHSDLIKTEGYSNIGIGIRSRNENLIFGTMQLKAFYFPRTIAGMTTFKLDFITNLRYRYTSNFVQKPEFLVVN